ncbi:hypothetical protein EYF80_021236 [Liparis tanakae]|uniref:Uncharacterized protein n=1 Tax=Liparis tanakae TaxID=230148 RepID=A0A4Z2HSG7_9TELE|nr:hypothetical protein EYF80_021236 [Liparis tanakae]
MWRSGTNVEVGIGPRPLVEADSAEGTGSVKSACNFILHHGGRSARQATFRGPEALGKLWRALCLCVPVGFISGCTTFGPGALGRSQRWTPARRWHELSELGPSFTKSGPRTSNRICQPHLECEPEPGRMVSPGARTKPTCSVITSTLTATTKRKANIEQMELSWRLYL